MADLKVALEELKEESDSGTLSAAPVRQKRSGRRLVWAGALLAILAAGGGTLWFIRSTAMAPEAVLTAVPLTTYPGFQEEPTFSPDGNQVAFSWDGEKRDNVDIYVKLIGTSGPPLRLTTNQADDHSPAWSPDGRFIAFLRDLSREKVAVLLIPALGGPEQKVAEILAGPDLLPGPFLAWSPDGNWLVVSGADSPKEPAALFLLSPETGEKRRLTSPPKPLQGDTCPAFSPDGRTLVFSRSADAGVGDLYLIALSAELRPLGEARRLTLGNRGYGKPAWTPDGHEIVFSGTSGELFRIAPSGSAEPRRLASLGDHIDQPAISPRGRRLAYSHRFFRGSIGRIAAPVGHSPRSWKVPTPVSATLFISSTRDDSSPQFSPDGKHIAFVSSRSGNREIWTSDGEGLNAVQVTHFGGAPVTTPRWSPDGGRIAFDSNATGDFDIWVVSANGGKPQRMTTHPANDGNPSWSRDGRWIYFDSARTGEQQVWKLPADGGEAIQLTRDGGFAPLESPDGKMLYYTKALTATSLWRMPIESGPATKVLDGLSSYLNLAIVGSGLYFVPQKAEAAMSIQFLDFETGQIKPVANLEKRLKSDAGSAGLAVSPDGRWILYSQVEQSGSELMLMENFR